MVILFLVSTVVYTIIGILPLGIVCPLLYIVSVQCRVCSVRDKREGAYEHETKTMRQKP